MVLSHKKLRDKKRSLQISASESNESSKSSSNPQVIEELQTVKMILTTITRKKTKIKRKLKAQSLHQNSNDNDVNEGAPKEEVKKGRKKREREEFVDEELLERRRIKKEKKLKRNEMREKSKKEKEKREKPKKEGAETKSSVAGSESVDFVENVEEEVKVSQSESKKVYVGGIPYYSSEDDIRSFFESCGTITEMDCMTFPETGKFRGIAFLTFKLFQADLLYKLNARNSSRVFQNSPRSPKYFFSCLIYPFYTVTEAAAKRALALDGADMGGFYLKIQPYKAKQQTSKPEFTPEVIDGYNRAYIGNLSWDITEDDLKSFFSDCKISTIRFGMDKDTGEFKGYAHIDFEDPVSLTVALKLDQHVVCGRPARISRAVPPKKVAGQPNKAAQPNDGLEKREKIEPKKEEEDGGTRTGSKKKRRTCYECGVPGHLSSACPKKKAAAVES